LRLKHVLGLEIRYSGLISWYYLCSLQILFEHISYAFALVGGLATPPSQYSMNEVIMLSCPFSIPRYVKERRQMIPEHIVMD
jgi:hypothetical protein